MEYLQVGDIIPTLEHGLQPIINIVREQIWLDPGTCPVSILPLDIPAGALGNAVPFILPIENAVALIGQPVKVTGVANVSIEGIDIAGFSGISHIQPARSTLVSKIYFEDDEFINVAEGASILCRTGALNIQRASPSPKRKEATCKIHRLDHLQADAFLLLLEEQSPVEAEMCD